MSFNEGVAVLKIENGDVVMTLQDELMQECTARLTPQQAINLASWLLNVASVAEAEHDEA